MESIGQQLKKEREARGLTLKDISLETKISLRYLEAIEDDRLEILPGGFFTRQIIKTYLTHIGLKPEEWLAKFNLPGQKSEEKPLEKDKESEEKGEPGTGEIKYYLASKEKFPAAPESPRQKEFPLNRVIWISLSVIIFGLFVFLIYLSIKMTEKEVAGRDAREKYSVQVVIPAEEKEESAAATGTQVEKEIPPPPHISGLTLELEFNEDCWIQVYADGNLVVDGLKQEGFRIQVRAESELVINLGNAGGVSYRLNGKPGIPFGRRGAVVKNIRITGENYSQFLQPEKSPE
ncbi:MAG: RodZ domain-containing protein [Candidatus Saccharicenans sp.]